MESPQRQTPGPDASASTRSVIRPPGLVERQLEIHPHHPAIPNLHGRIGLQIGGDFKFMNLARTRIRFPHGARLRSLFFPWKFDGLLLRLSDSLPHDFVQSSSLRETNAEKTTGALEPIQTRQDKTPFLHRAPVPNRLAAVSDTPCVA